MREVTAASGNFNWSNPAAWVDSVPGVVSAAPNNTVISYTAGARYYDVTLGNPGTITLDMDPTIDTLAITGSQSELVIPEGFTLTTVLSTTVSAGTLAVIGGELSSPEISVSSGAMLGGVGTIAGNVTNAGTVAVGSAMPGFNTSPVGILTVNGNFTNSGALNLAGGKTPGNILEIQGNYVGQGGTLAINTFLGGDKSPSDELVISGGNASGTTTVHVTNTGGPGKLTTNDGILVVDAINNATTDIGSFKLGNEVAAGPFEYRLFRGGVSPGTADDWYLRSSMPGPPSGPPVPIYRPTAGLYMLAPGIARQSTLFALGTFNERHGDQTLMAPTGEGDPAIWGRVFGERLTQDWAGDLDPRFDGQIGALQAGFDVLRFELLPGGTDHLGVFYTYESAGGDARAFVLGQQGNVAGTLAMNTNSIAGYWTHVGEDTSYIDAVVMGSFYGAHANSPDKVTTNLTGHGITGSLESGYPFPISDTIALEAQGQIIVQSLHFTPAADPFTSLDFNDNIGVSGRVGLSWRTTS